MKVNDINDNLFGDITKGYYRFYYRKQQFFPPRISSHTQLFEVFHILAPLHDTPFIACLIFGTNQRMRRAAAQRAGIEIACGIPDGVFNVAAVNLGRAEDPFLLTGIIEKIPQGAAFVACAAELAVALPVWRRG